MEPSNKELSKSSLRVHSEFPSLNYILTLINIIIIRKNKKREKKK